MKKTVLISAPKYYGSDTDIKEAFETLGFNALLINHYQLTILERIAKKIRSKLRFLKPILNPIIKSYLIKENSEFLSIVSKEMPDLLFIIKGDNFFPATLEKIKKVLSCPVVGYAWDEPFYTHNNNQDDYRKSNFKKGLPWYDLIFVFDTFYIDEIKRQGAKKVHYLPLATNPNRYSEIATIDQDRCHYDYDVCFIGMPFENRVEIFENLHAYKLGVFGDHWGKYFMLKGQPPPAYYKGKATGEVVNKLYRSSKIVLNIHHSHSIEGLNTRTFDILACGAFEMVDYKKNVEEHFEIDKEIVTFENINELKSKIEFYSRNDDLRKAISERGRQRVLSEHTWVHRAKDVVTAVADLCGCFNQCCSNHIHGQI
jgi:spore maturation protein CgeB